MARAAPPTVDWPDPTPGTPISRLATASVVNHAPCRSESQTPEYRAAGVPPLRIPNEILAKPTLRVYDPLIVNVLPDPHLVLPRAGNPAAPRIPSPRSSPFPIQHSSFSIRISAFEIRPSPPPHPLLRPPSNERPSMPLNTIYWADSESAPDGLYAGTKLGRPLAFSFSSNLLTLNSHRR